MSDKNHILIVEDSLAIGMLLKNYLEKLGYTEIHTCSTGASAIVTFKDLVNQNNIPIVLLDYMLPDMDARSILTQMLEIRPDARVVLETATDKDDEGIKDLVRLGAYQYIEKPIRFEDLKNIIEIIENEESFFQKKSEQVQMSEQAGKKIDAGIIDRLSFVLKSAKQISLNKIMSTVGFSDDTIVSHLEKFEKDGKIIQTGLKKEIACNQCDSVKISQAFYCPNCKGSDFKMGKLIEHYDCGNITEDSTYQNDMCPNCNKEIKALGVDYRVMRNHYICNNCDDFFPEISIEYLCLQCENKFRIEDARWKSSVNYKVINM